MHTLFYRKNEKNITYRCVNQYFFVPLQFENLFFE